MGYFLELNYFAKYIDKKLTMGFSVDTFIAGYISQATTGLDFTKSIHQIIQSGASLNIRRLNDERKCLQRGYEARPRQLVTIQIKMWLKFKQVDNFKAVYNGSFCRPPIDKFSLTIREWGNDKNVKNPSDAGVC